MDASLTLIIIMAVLFAAGVYAMMERSLTRVLIGFLLLGNATNLLLLIVMGVPGRAPFYGEEGPISDPLPQALTLTAIVITFAVSAFLLALIYRSWQLGQADTVQDDESDIAVRERTDAEEEMFDDESDTDDEATTDFVGVVTAPITVLHMRDHPSIHDDAPVDVPDGVRPSSRRSAPRSGTGEGVAHAGVTGDAEPHSPVPERAERDEGRSEGSSPASDDSPPSDDSPGEDRR